LLGAAVVVPHGPRQLLVVHLHAAVRLHQAPRPGIDSINPLQP
jgi:hypothetical protein